MQLTVTIQIADKQAILADGQWRSDDEALGELLELHLATLKVPAHWPPSDRQLAAARAAVEAFGGNVISTRRMSQGPSRRRDGRQIVFSGPVKE